MIFCDYLNVWQEFPDWQGGDHLGGKVVSVEGAAGFGRALVVDGETGELSEVWAFSGAEEVEYAASKFKPETGSYETRIFIRMVGGKLEVRGNPSAWGRLDNLFGVTLDEGMAIYNDILESLGLPLFTSGERVSNWLETEGKLLHGYTGAHITRVDMTENLTVGMGNVRDYHRWIAGQKFHRSAPGDDELREYAKWNFGTVYSSVSKYWINVKHYDKASALEDVTLPQYLKKLKDGVKSGRLSRSEVQPLYKEAEDYLSKLAEWCAEQGITRSEWSFRNRWFTQHAGAGWWRPGSTSETLLAHVEQERSKVMERAVVHQPGREENLPAAAYKALVQWREGRDVRELLPRNTFYRHRAAILARLGIDIASRPLVSQRSAERRPVYFKIAPVGLSQAPRWYVPASIPLRMAA